MNDNIAFLGTSGSAGFTQFKASADKAIALMKQHGGVVTNDHDLLHMTVQYLCCYSVATYTDMITIISKVKWAPLHLYFKGVICNNGGDGNSNDISVIVTLDPPSQQAVLSVVEQFEAAINASKIPIHKPRRDMEPFHSTLGVVTSSYPVSDVVDLINQQIPVFNTDPVIINSFFMVAPFWIFNSSSLSIDI